MYVAQKQQYSI